MHIEEYNKVKNISYDEYCNYLKNKYGVVRDDYMTPDFKKKRGYSRTRDGLITHHIMEKEAPAICHIKMAQHYPYEWQTKEYLCYCDYLEHLLLHIKLGGFCGADIITGELNDIYSHSPIPQPWKQICAQKIINDENVYLAIMEDHINSLTKEVSISRLNMHYCGSDYYVENSISLKKNAAIYDNVVKIRT